MLFLKKTLLKKGKGKYKGMGFEQVAGEFTKSEAIGMGIKLTGESAKQSFYIKPTGGTIEGTIRPELEDIKRRLLYRYRTAKKNANIYIQKVQYAISSRQEKLEIPFAGQKALRRKSKKMKWI